MSAPAWIQVFLDVPRNDFQDAVTFWSAVTGWQPSERRGEDGQFLTLLPAAGSAYLKMQAVDGPAGMHLDLDSTDRPAAVDRARELGATHAWSYHDVEVMRSPGGFVFCQTLVDGDPSLERDGSTILDQVCLDVPPEHWESEVAFWAALTGREPQVGALPGFVRLVQDGRLRLLLQRLDEPDGPVRAHPDLATAWVTPTATSGSARRCRACTTSGPSSWRRAGRSTASPTGIPHSAPPGCDERF